MKMMKTEKTVRQQARAALKGNLTTLIAAAGIVYLTYLALTYANRFMLFLTNSVDLETGSVVYDFPNTPSLLALGNMALIILLSPLLNGFLRASANVARYKSCSATDVFFFFGGLTRYFRTIIINLMVFMLCVIASTALDPERWFRTLFSDLVPAQLGFDPASFAVIFFGVLSMFIRILLYLLFVHFPLTALALNDEIGVFECVFVMMLFSIKNFGKLFKLMLSFAGWFLLCFLVVPALYVIPYVRVSAMTSAKWLFELDERRVVI